MRPFRGGLTRVGALAAPAIAAAGRAEGLRLACILALEALGCLAAEEAARFDRIVLVPLGLGAGILAYFAAPEEPGLVAPGVASVGLVALAVALRRRSALFGLALLVASAAIGFGAAALRSAVLAGPRLEQPAGGRLAGFVLSLDERAKGGARLVLRPTAIEGIAPGALPRRVRITVADSSGLSAGDTVGLRIALRPPPGPAYPGGFDFARAAYFEGIAASGYGLGKAEVLPAVHAEMGERLAAWLDRQRNRLTARIVAAIPGEDGAVAASQVTGKRGLIPDEANDVLRAAGLYHVVSISGLHMALFAGGLFALIRAGLALSSRLALSLPLKTIAAAASLVPAAFYTVFSGAEVATVRAFLMTAIVLLAVALQRSAVTRRNLALAATALLLVTPEELVGPSFQMSFAAVGLLVAWADTPVLRRVGGALPGEGAAFWLGRAALLLLVTTIVASLATAPFAAYHFHRVTLQSLVANLLAAPIVSGLIMPSALLALVAEPFGYGEPAWALMGLAVSWFMAVARMVAAWPGAEIALPQMSPVALSAFAIGILGLMLLRTRLAFLTALPVAAGIAMAASAEPPLALIGDGGRMALVRGETGLTLIGGTGRDFATRQWLGAMGEALRPDDPALVASRRCDPEGCSAPLRGGGRLMLDTTANAMSEDCGRVPVLVAPLDIPARCGRDGAIVLGRTAVVAAGAIALHADPASPGGLRVEAAETGARRPWSAPAAVTAPPRAVSAEPLGFEEPGAF